MMKRSITILLMLLTSLSAHGHDNPPVFNRINLAVSAQQEVDNDILVAVMYAQEEGNNATSLAKSVNRDIASAVKQAKQRDGIKVQTLDYTTDPIYRQQTLNGWRVRQSIRLESRDPASLSELIGDLQRSLSVDRIQYVLSPEARTMIEDKLITEAIDRFNQRAKLIREQMGRESHQLVQMNINSSGHSPRPRMAMAQMELSKNSAPALEAGTQTVTINISGTIELLVD